MRVFVTGATGYVGSGIVRELRAAGHEVTGMTRSAGNVAALEAMGVRALVADLKDPDGYRHEAAGADAIVHAAAEESGERAAVDRAAVDTLLRAAREGDATVLVYTSGCFVLGETGDAPAHEDASTDGAPEMVAWRPPHEQRVLEAATDELATSVIRPGMLYGGRGGTFADFFATAEEEDAAALVGDGTNRWSPVYQGDVARLYRMVVERGGRGIFHCAEPAEPVEALAVAASRAAGAGGATRHVPLDAAREEMGTFADALTMDQVVGCARARAFGWEPRHPPFTTSADAVYEEWKRRG